MNERALPTCPGKVEVPTENERQALAAMRSIKERVRTLKGYLSDLDASESDEHGRMAEEMREELARLKADWDRWEEKRQRAARERMILLGHEDG